MTNRLAYLSSEIQPILDKEYTQVYANLYVYKKYMSDEIKKKIDISGSFGIPILMF